MKLLHATVSDVYSLHFRNRNGKASGHSDTAELGGILSSAARQYLWSYWVLGPKPGPLQRKTDNRRGSRP